MTTDIKQLTDRELDIAISIALGKWMPLPEVQDPKSLWDDIAFAKLINSDPPMMPYYSTSLDDMHKIEKLLPPLDIPVSSNPSDFPSWEYGWNLSQVLGLRLYDNGKWIGSHIGWLPLVMATARQKAEAFLKTMEDYNERKAKRGY